MSHRHRNIPLFIPHLGCPNNCIFCNQRSISGKTAFSLDTVRHDIEQALSTIPDKEDTEIAFFGGSFTGIDREDMCALLEIAEEYVRSGRVSSIRLSTRPDYIDKEVLDILSSYSVRTVELGIQSMSDRVLAACRRGHKASDTVSAAKLLREAGFSLVGQMMTGLPEATPEDELDTAQAICALGVDAVRIYPTVVLKHTPLADDYFAGRYLPPSEEESIARAADVFDIFKCHRIPVLRIGLQAGEALCKEKDLVGGFYHEAMGELVEGEWYYRRIKDGLDACRQEKGVVRITVPKGKLSLAIGHRGRNRTRLIKEYPHVTFLFAEDADMIGDAPSVAAASL